MRQEHASPELRTEASRHVMGRFGGTEDGPLVVAVGGMHGNEPAGVAALRRVLRDLRDLRPRLRGSFVALCGNPPALSRRRRFLEADLNRLWTLDRTRALREAPSEEPGGSRGEPGELSRQAALLRVLDDVLAPATPRTGPSTDGGEPLREGPSDGAGPSREVVVLDLHTTSSESVPFITFSDTLRNRAFARHYPVPLVLGVEEELEGTLLDFVNHLGHVAVGVEGGSHDDPASVDHLETAVWLGLVAAGSLGLDDLPPGGDIRGRLDEASRGVPRLFEVRYRHALREGDGFRMEPGFHNFQEVEAGELLATDRRGEIRAPESGRIFLPLYQRQGEEGFFIVREVAGFWLWLSEWLRRLRVDALARWLPGVRAHPEREDSLVVHPRVAGPLMVQLFHLLGYRRERPRDGELILTRRKEAAEEAHGG